MNHISQGDAVFQATMSVLDSENVTIAQDRPIASQVTKEQRVLICATVFQMFRDGVTAFKSGTESKFNADAKLNQYVSGLVSNWFRKDRRLNGGVAYVPKSTGTRSGDAQLKNLRLLLGNYEAGTEEFEAVQSAIEARTSEISTAKRQVVTPDLSKIPAELRATLGIHE